MPGQASYFTYLQMNCLIILLATTLALLLTPVVVGKMATALSPSQSTITLHPPVTLPLVPHHHPAMHQHLL